MWDALHGKDKDGKHREAYVWHTMVRNALLKSWGIDMVDVLCLVCMYVFLLVILVISEHVQTCADSSIKESDQERQRNAEEVEDLRKQLSKAAAEACLHWLALAMSHYVGNIAWQGWQIDSLAGIDMG